MPMTLLERKGAHRGEPKKRHLNSVPMMILQSLCALRSHEQFGHGLVPFTFV